VSGNEPVPRKALLEFAAEVDQYLRSGTANLQEHRLYALGSQLGSEIPEDAPTPRSFARCRPSVPTNDAAQLPKEAPLCAGFSRATR
jgi:hypothetical protein